MATENPTKIHFPKGEGFKIIKQASEANVNDSVYFLPINREFAEIIIVDPAGRKRRVGFNLPANTALIDLFDEEGNLISEGNVYTKVQVDSFIQNLQVSYDVLENRVQNTETKNIEQDNRLDNLDSTVTDHESRLNTVQSAVSNHENRIVNLEGINYTWNPSNRNLTLFDNNGNVLSQVSLVSLDDEGTDLRYNPATKSLELYNKDGELLDSIPVVDFVGNVGSQLLLNSNTLQLKDSQGNILSSVTFEISNIGGLQDVLNTLQTSVNGKMDKPASTGSYYANKSALGGAVTWRAINPAVAYLLYWNGNDFNASGLYTDGTKYGIGTTAPTEMLHLNNGRLRTKAIVFDNNAETIPNQITFDGTNWLGTNSGGVKKTFFWKEDFKTEFVNTPATLTDAQKITVRNNLRLSTESFSLGTPRIDVLLLPFIDNTKNFIQYTTLVGLNLFVDNITPNAYIKIRRVKDVNGTSLPAPETYDVDNFTVLQNFPNNLNFGINWFNKPEGYYQVFVTHNNLTNVSSPELIVKSGLTYSQFTGIANWHKDSGGDASVNDTAISSGSQPTVYYSNDLISTAEVNAGFMVSFSLNNQLYNYGANFIAFWKCGLIGNGDGVFYGVQYYDGGGTGMLPNTIVPIRNDTFHIAYYNGVVYVIAEGNGKTYQQFNSTYNLYPKRFIFHLSGGGQGSISMQLLGKILLS